MVLKLGRLKHAASQPLYCAMTSGLNSACTTVVTLVVTPAASISSMSKTPWAARLLSAAMYTMTVHSRLPPPGGGLVPPLSPPPHAAARRTPASSACRILAIGCVLSVRVPGIKCRSVGVSVLQQQGVTAPIVLPEFPVNRLRVLTDVLLVVPL